MRNKWFAGVYGRISAVSFSPVKEMFDTYMERVHSRGELGVLSSLNQRVWREYNDLKIYLENKIKEK